MGTFVPLPQGVLQSLLSLFLSATSTQVLGWFSVPQFSLIIILRFLTLVFYWLSPDSLLCSDLLYAMQAVFWKFSLFLISHHLLLQFVILCFLVLFILWDWLVPFLAVIPISRLKSLSMALCSSQFLLSVSSPESWILDPLLLHFIHFLAVWFLLLTYNLTINFIPFFFPSFFPSKHMFIYAWMLGYYLLI